MKPKYKVGDRFNAPTSIREILAVSVAVSGVARYWVDDDGDRDPTTVHESQIDRWVKIEPFFEVGKTYRWRSRIEGEFGHDTWRIEDIREVDGMRYAWALYTNGYTGSREMAQLYAGSFGEMTEA